MATIQIGNSSIDYISYSCGQECCDLKMGNSIKNDAIGEIGNVKTAYRDEALANIDQINAVQDAILHFIARRDASDFMVNFWGGVLNWCEWDCDSFCRCKNHPQACNSNEGTLRDRVDRSQKIRLLFVEAISDANNYLTTLQEQFAQDVNNTHLIAEADQVSALAQNPIYESETGLIAVKKKEFDLKLKKYILPVVIGLAGLWFLFIRKK